LSYTRESIVRSRLDYRARPGA